MKFGIKCPVLVLSVRREIAEMFCFHTAKSGIITSWIYSPVPGIRMEACGSTELCIITGVVIGDAEVAPRPPVI